MLTSSLWYPFTGSGAYLLGLYSVLLWLSAWVPFPIVDVIARVVVMSYVGVLLMETATFALEGIPGGPRFPDLLSWETISVGMLGVGVFLISGLPLIIGLSVMLSRGEVSWFVLSLLLAVSLFYLPLGLVALAERQNESALNPLVVLRGLPTIGKQSLALCALAAALFIIPLAVLRIVKAHPLVQQLVIGCMFLYVATALVRAVALVTRRHLPVFEDDDEHER